MSTCVPTPVSTAFSTVTENTIITTYSLSTSTAPSVITTRVDPYCQNEAVVLDSAVCLKTGTRTRTGTLEPASDVVYTIPYETTIPVVTQVPISTFYGGCSDTPTSPDGNGGGSGPGSGNGSNPGSNNPGSGFDSGNGTNSGSSGNSGGAISVPPGHTLVTSSVLVYTTGPPETSVIPSIMTLPNGQITTTSVLTVVTPKPSQVYVPTTALVEATGNSNPGSQKCGNLGVIVGAVIGGFVGLCLMILAWWYVRRKRKMTYDEILHEHEKQIEDQEARRQAIERSKDPNRNRESDPRPTPYHYGSVLSSGGRIQTSTSTGVTLSQNPFEGSGVGNRATYMAQGSPLFTTVPIMEEFGVGSGLGVLPTVGAGGSGFGGHDEARDPMNPSASSTFCTSGTDPGMSSAATLESTSCRSNDLDCLPSDGSADEFVEVDIGGVEAEVVRRSRVISPPPHLSMSFGSWNTSSSKRSSGVDPVTDPGPGSTDGGHRSEGDEGRRRLLRLQQHQRHTVEGHPTATLVQKATAQENVRSHLRKRSGSPVSWAPPARGTLFIVNQRSSEDL